MPDPGGGRAWTPTERSLTAIWQELLEVEVDRDDDFIDVGGDSLVAMRIVSWVWKRLGVRITVREVYALRRPADLATVIDERLARGGPVFDDGPIRRGDRLPEQPQQ